MNIETRVPLKKLVGLLHAKLRELQAGKANADRIFAVEVAKWRIATKKWIVKEGVPFIDRVTATRISAESRYDGPWSNFFETAPPRPKPPKHRERILNVKTLLRQLSIAQPKDVRVDTRWVQKYLEDGEDDE